MLCFQVETGRPASQSRLKLFCVLYVPIFWFTYLSIQRESLEIHGTGEGHMCTLCQSNLFVDCYEKGIEGLEDFQHFVFIYL